MELSAALVFLPPDWAYLMVLMAVASGHRVLSAELQAVDHHLRQYQQELEAVDVGRLVRNGRSVDRLVSRKHNVVRRIGSGIELDSSGVTSVAVAKASPTRASKTKGTEVLTDGEAHVVECTARTV